MCAPNSRPGASSETTVAVSDTRGEQHEHDDDLQAHRLQRVGAGEDHAGHRPRQEDYAHRLGAVDDRHHGEPHRAADDARRALPRRSAQRQGRLDLGAPVAGVLYQAHRGHGGDGLPGRDPQRPVVWPMSVPA